MASPTRNSERRPSQWADAIADMKLRDESACVAWLLANVPYASRGTRQINRQAARWVRAIRRETHRQSLLDSFLAEYGLSNAEGVALMCLAEAFLRIPDNDTAELLVKDKLADRDWAAHLGKADSWLVNSSTWALMLTGRTLNLGGKGPGDWLQSLLGKLGAPVLNRAVRTAMQILGNEFVLGETISEALSRSKHDPHIAYSYDMLGEGARNRASAERYRRAYENAIIAVGTAATHANQRPSSVSIKLSALHPRYEPLQQSRSGPELLDTLTALCALAQQHDVPISIDAEESERLQFSLDLFAALCDATPAWDGLGLVVQAYSKRAPAIIDWLADLARGDSRRIPVRLVKGAYWDAEIKRTQERGLTDFPVYTRKATTDAAYLVCARKLLDCRDLLQAQFATHNAHTVAAVLHMAEGSRSELEFQRLHGMGEHLYEVVRKDHPDLVVRVYAPVGAHTDLLAYLVRRLLENGANSSFVNRLLDADLPVRKLLQDPFVTLSRYPHPRNPQIALPRALYGDTRVNSEGLDVSDLSEVARHWDPDRFPAPNPVASHSPVVENTVENTEIDVDQPSPVTPGGPASDITTHPSPADTGKALGTVIDFPLGQVEAAFEVAASAQQQWDALGGVGRAEYLEAFANLLQGHRSEFYSLLCHEAGKTLEDCIAEVREAIDFCRYYASQARLHFAAPTVLPGPTGESNQLSLHGRGVFVCISPWNFPLAIFIGQVSAALAAGNSVLAKPAEPTPRIARLAVELLHQAGVPAPVCQLTLGGARLGTALVGSPLCAGVAFTGSTAVAQLINRQLAAREGPIPVLVAETGGQNAMLVDSTALLEQVTDDVLRSAFLSSGQRCSALRILCLQDEIADDAVAMIRGAMQELIVGHPRHITTDMGPIITADALRALCAHVEHCRTRGFDVYQPPLPTDLSGHYCPPTLIEISSPRDLTEEHFGPILHIVRFDAEHLDAVVDDVNASGYGLTFGVHSRLTARAEHLADAIRAGNVYVNRNMVGAVVGTQPFGGQGLSGTGPKAGGPHYLPRFGVEKTVSYNTAATGGNVELLALNSP